MKRINVPARAVACMFAASLFAPWPAALAEDWIEVVVESSPLKAPLQDLPGSASVFTESSVERTDSTRFTEILDETPNLTYTGGTSRPRFFQIRGIGELEQYEGAPNPSVGLVYDDLDLSGLGLPLSMFDVEQIEVLRGPQATKFGANALAGVITLRSARPGPEASGRAQISGGSDEYMDGGFAAGGKLLNSDVLFVRVAGYHQESDGYRKNLYLGRDDTNRQNDSDGRFQLRYQPSPDTTADLELLLAAQRDGYDAFAINNAFTTQSDRPGRDTHDLWGLKLNLEHKLDSALKLQSTTSYSDSSLDYAYDGDWGNNPFWVPYAPYDYQFKSSRSRQTLSHEMRIASETPGRVSWLGGVFGQHMTEGSRIQQFQDGERYELIDTDYHAEAFAGFGAVEVPLVNSLFAGLTGRSERRNTDFSDSRGAGFDPGWNMWGGSSYLRYEVSEDQQLYGLISRGYKGGGYNPGPSVPSDRQQYNPEYLWNYETGYHGQRLLDVFDIDLSLFYAERYDQQVKLALQDDPSDPLSFTYLTDNVASGHNYGLEGRIAARPVDQLDVILSGSLLNTDITTGDPSVENLNGRDQSVAPHAMYALTSRYTFTSAWYLQGQLTGKSPYYFDDSNDQRSDSYHLVNVELGWERENWRVAFWGKNIFNEHYAVRGFYFGEEPPDYPNKLYIQRGDPGSYGVTVSYLF